MCVDVEDGSDVFASCGSDAVLVDRVGSDDVRTVVVGAGLLVLLGFVDSDVVGVSGPDFVV